MKRRIRLILASMLLVCASASAQEYVSVSEIYEQAEAIGGWWTESFDTPNGQINVDVPIIVPDVDTMPVLTVEKAKLSNEMFDQIASGQKLEGR